MNSEVVINIDGVYVDLLQQALEGVHRASRGLEYLEIRPAPVVVQIDPRYSTITARKLNEAFALIERMSYLSGQGFYPSIITAYNKNYENYVEPNFIDPGSYGYRISRQLLRAFKLLKDDRYTRQAVINVYNYLEDNRGDVKNVPCTIALNFYIEQDDTLCLIAYMRSNDLIWGFPYDVSAFCFLQQVMARWLGRPVGTYKHVATSLHLYVNKIEEAREVIKNYYSTFNHPLTADKEWDVPFDLTAAEVRKFWQVEEMIRVNHVPVSADDIIATFAGCEYLQSSLATLALYWKKRREKNERP